MSYAKSTHDTLEALYYCVYALDKAKKSEPFLRYKTNQIIGAQFMCNWLIDFITTGEDQFRDYIKDNEEARIALEKYISLHFCGKAKQLEEGTIE